MSLRAYPTLLSALVFLLAAKPSGLRKVGVAVVDAAAVVEEGRLVCPSTEAMVLFLPLIILLGLSLSIYSSFFPAAGL